jgi:hypothetical protein
MDDSTNGYDRYSRAPELEDLVNLCRWLNDEGVRYMLIGGFAVILHGSVRGTKDIDLLVDASDENIRALKRAMGKLPDDAIALVADDDVRNYTVVRVADEIVVDLMAAACGIDYQEAVREGLEHAEIEGVRVPLASKQLLIRMKDTIRDSDKSDVAFLRVLIEEEQGEPR